MIINLALELADNATVFEAAHAIRESAMIASEHMLCERHMLRIDEELKFDLAVAAGKELTFYRSE